jgi:manganese transport protein
MYRKILVALENGPADETLLPHIGQLARLLGAELLLLHVADGFAARNFDQLKLAESEEMRADKAYLETAADKLRATGLKVATQLALGDPPTGILLTAAAAQCDLIAMASHGHRFVGDLIYGSTIHKVRHDTEIPVLLVRAAKKLG